MRSSSQGCCAGASQRLLSLSAACIAGTRRPSFRPRQGLVWRSANGASAVGTKNLTFKKQGCFVPVRRFLQIRASMAVSQDATRLRSPRVDKPHNWLAHSCGGHQQIAAPQVPRSFKSRVMRCAKGPCVHRGTHAHLLEPASNDSCHFRSPKRLGVTTRLGGSVRTGRHRG